MIIQTTTLVTAAKESEPASWSPLWALLLVAAAGVVVVVMAVITVTRGRRPVARGLAAAPTSVAGVGYPTATVWHGPHPDAPVPAPSTAPHLATSRAEDSAATRAHRLATIHMQGMSGVAGMQTIGPYRLQEIKGRSDIGVVWSAVDADGQPVSVAILDASSASDQQWRHAFIVTANALARQEHDPLPILSVDYTSPTPWVAAPAGPGLDASQIFLALGLSYQAAAEVGDVSAQPPLSSGTAGADPLSSGSAAPFSSGPAGADPAAAGDGEVTRQVQAPVSAPATEPVRPISAVPVSGPPTAIPPPPVPPPPRQYAIPAPYSIPVVPAPISRDLAMRPAPVSAPPEPPSSRIRLWIGLVVLIVLLGGGGAAVYAWTTGSERDTTTPSTTPSAVSEPPALPNTPPLEPGLEPPKEGKWPAGWPKFSATDQVKTLNDLPGLDFTLKVPLDWECGLAGRAQGAVKYTCGSAVTGGELIVRECAEPCGANQQTEMRQAEEAWGAQWISCGQNCALAEKLLDVDGQTRHALIVVAYWRGGNDGQLDHQLVLRMTSPQTESYRLRQVASYLRDQLLF